MSLYAEIAVFGGVRGLLSREDSTGCWEEGEPELLKRSYAGMDGMKRLMEQSGFLTELN